MSHNLNIRYYVINVEFRYEHTICDEFGWVEGHGPGCGDWRKKKETYRIRTENEVYAKAWVEHHCRDVCDLHILSVKKETLHIDAFIDVSQ